MKRAERRGERYLCLLQLLNWIYMDSASAVLRTTYINLLLLIKWCYFLIHFNYWGYLNTLMKVPLCFYWLIFEQYFWILSLAYYTSFLFFLIMEVGIYNMQTFCKTFCVHLHLGRKNFATCKLTRWPYCIPLHQKVNVWIQKYIGCV